MENAQKQQDEAGQWQSRMASALNALLNNTQEGLSPPLQLVHFSACSDPATLCHVGKLSAPQYDRLGYLVRAAGSELRVSPSVDHKDSDILRWEIRGGNLEALEALASQEAVRRTKAKEALPILKSLTGLDWEWDGLCLTTPYPGEQHPAHQVLGEFRSRRVTQHDYDLAVCRTGEGESVGNWLTLHDFNMNFLKQMSAKNQGISLT